MALRKEYKKISEIWKTETSSHIVLFKTIMLLCHKISLHSEENLMTEKNSIQFLESI